MFWSINPPQVGLFTWGSGHSPLILFLPHVSTFLFSSSRCVHLPQKGTFGKEAKVCFLLASFKHTHCVFLFPQEFLFLAHCSLYKKGHRDEGGRQQRVQGMTWCFWAPRVTFLRMLTVEGNLVLNFSFAVTLFCGGET